MSGRSDGPNRSGEPSSGFETSRDFAASREEYAFDDGDQEGSEAEGEGLEEDYGRLMDRSDSADYYSLLGLSRNPPPTDSRIRGAFHTLSLSFHPDKQPLHLRDKAREQYAKIQKAYDTLIDPQKRVVYDLLGVEGVKTEWGAGGVMGKSGEGQERRVGVKAMTSAEFRRWFLAAMKRRERGALEEMVGSAGEMGMGLDARPFFVPLFSRLGLVEEMADESFAAPQLTSFQVQHNFRAPLAWLTGAASDLGGMDNVSPYRTFQTETSQLHGVPNPKESSLVLHGSIGGALGYQKQNVVLDDSTETKQFTLPPFLLSRAPSLSVGASFRYLVPEALKGTTPMRWVWSLMQGSALTVEAALLDEPSLEVAVIQQFTPIAGTKPVRGRLGLNFRHNVICYPPAIEIGFERSLSPGQDVFCSWTSGHYSWNDLPVVRPLVQALRLGREGFLVDPQPDSFAIGFSSRSSDLDRITESPSTQETTEEDENEDSTTGTKWSSGPSWRVMLFAPNPKFNPSLSPVSLSINHTRDIFGGSIDAPSLSSWSADEFHAPSADLGPKPQSNPVRLEIHTTASLDMSVNVTLSGTRKVGEFARIGLGISFGSQDNLSVLVTWSRLGQRLAFPIAVCPSHLSNSGIIQALILLPLATFTVFEFGFLRPRARRKWLKTLERRRKELMRRVAEKRVESAQAIELMTSQVKRRQTEEATRDGLVIIHAEYGVPRSIRLKKNGRSAGLEEFIDVTMPMAGLVSEGQLLISRQVKKSHILGFYDPAPLRRKTLRVRYRFGGVEHFVEVEEGENLVCPMNEHKVSSIYDLE